MLSGYVDIHAHVLPGIDDGPEDLGSALAMLQAAAASGITTIAATPHLRSDFPNVRVRELAERCGQVRAAIEREGIGIELVSGAEASIAWAMQATDEELLLASYGQRGRDLLIEAPTVNVLGLEQILDQIRTKGYRITLAHPERSMEFRRDVSLLKSLVAQGVLLQINAESVLGPRNRRGLSHFARELCREGLAHVIASDAHRARSWRPVGQLADAVGAVTGLVGGERASWMTRAASAAIIAGTSLPAPPPPATRERQRWPFRRA